jgi:DNA sulfur modification protein DndD
MLKLTRLLLEDFGPFKGVQTVDWPTSGVAIVFGENMHGKTSLLNAIRYGLFGKVIGRGSRALSLAGMVNWEALDEKRFGFRVVLSMDVDGHAYELTRQCRPRQAGIEPHSDADYETECVLRIDGDAVGPGERDRLLTQILPEQVARFFLFDGELLQEYEELLRNDSEQGRKIREAIERILGVPVLTNARADLTQLHQDAYKQFGRAASRIKEFEEYGNTLEMLMEQRAAHEADLVQRKGALAELEDEKAARELELRKMERAASLMSERDGQVTALHGLSEQMDSVRGEVTDCVGGLWRAIVGGVATTRRTAIMTEVAARQSQITANVRFRAKLTDAKSALGTGECPTCARPLDESARSTLEEFAADADTLGPMPEDDTGGLAEMTRTANLLGRFEGGSQMAVVQRLHGQYNDLLVRRMTVEDFIREKEREIENIDQSEVRRVRREVEDLAKRIALAEEGVRKTGEQAKTVDENARLIQKQLRKSPGGEMGTERLRADLCEQLKDLFAASVDVYRDRLRQQVEKDASSYFVQLTTERQFAGLRINQNYGLTIMHSDGRPIPVRSAGAEHVVALSLMGALQRNAPLRGPIVMDSPFGRLDEGHTTRVVKTLPTMAEQVVLLVYRSELDQTQARNDLGAQLTAEYGLVRKSARHTDIVRM